MITSSRRTFIASTATLGTMALFGAGRVSALAKSAAPAGLILGEGPPGRCDDAKNGGPVVRWNPENRRWFMWYYCRDHAFPADIAPAFGDGRIALATSIDGRRWERFDGPLTGGAVMEMNPRTGSFDELHIGSGDVTRHGDEWILWYFGGENSKAMEVDGVPVPPSYQARGYRMRPGVARSKDGINWTRIEGKATGGAAIEIVEGNLYSAFPSGIHDGKRWLMYYSTLSPKKFYWETRIAESTDLVNWSDLGPLLWDREPGDFEKGGSVTRNIMRNPYPGPKWLMAYVALDSRDPFFTRKVSVAVSDDAITWQRLYDEPIFVPGPKDSWDGGGITYPQFVATKKELRLYYQGYADMSMKPQPQPNKGLGMAVAKPGDFRGFKRVII